jgi:hypothetical protein
MSRRRHIRLLRNSRRIGDKALLDRRNPGTMDAIPSGCRGMGFTALFGRIAEHLPMAVIGRDQGD